MNAATTDRTVLISGTSSGIGLATAIACAEAGWTTVATMRNTAKAGPLEAAAAVAGVTVDVRTLDVTDPDAAAACVASVVADHSGLDAVVNNAGAAHVGTIETDDLAAVRACLEVNYFGVVNVARAAMPQLRASAGRMLTISSVGGAVGQPFNEAYCAAKFAVEGFLQSLAPVAGTVGVRIGVIEPGAVTSEFVANAGLDVPAMIAAAGDYAPALRAYFTRTMAMFEAGVTHAQTTGDVAAVVVDALQLVELPFRIQTSRWAADFVGLSLADRDGSRVLDATGGWVTG